MKKNFLYMMSAALLAVSCNSARIEDPLEYGTISLSLAGDPEIEVITKGELSAAEAKDYNIWVCDTDGNVVVESQDFKSSIIVPAGDYVVWAESCTESEAETDFGCRRYLGSSGEQEVTVVPGGLAEATVNCYVANALVEVVFHSSIKNQISGNISVELKREAANGVGVRTVTLKGTYVEPSGTDEEASKVNSKEVWFTSGSTITYKVSGITTGGDDLYSEGTLSDLQPKSWTQLVIKVSSDGTLTLVPNVNTDVTEGTITAPYNPYL